jgi:hypothetical protein
LADFFCSKFRGEKKFISVYQSFFINESNFAKFKKRTYRRFNLKNNLKKISLPSQKDGQFSPTELGIGLGMASGLAANRFYYNSFWLEYINFVGNQLVETSDIYDWNLKFFILDTPEIGTFVCPGGIILVSKGLLETVETEAELAFVLAREIASTSCYLGMEELFSEKDNFLKLSFAESSINKSFQDSLFSKLDSITTKIYANLFVGKTEKNSFLADSLGLIYAARAGYNSSEALNLFARLLLIEPLSLTEEYNILQIEKRMKMMKNTLSRIELPQKLFSHKKRWKEKEVFLN